MSVPNILAPEQLATVRRAFVGSSVIVEHRFLFGGRAPASIVFDDYEAFEEYLRAEVRPGDALWFWRYNDLCRDDNAVTRGNYPDAKGSILPGEVY